MLLSEEELGRMQRRVPYPHFSQVEYERRYENIRRMMRQSELDAPFAARWRLDASRDRAPQLRRALDGEQLAGGVARRPPGLRGFADLLDALGLDRDRPA